MPRFVVLEHDHPELHWDLMLEAGAVLRTWRLHAPPPLTLPSPPAAGGEGRVRGGAVRASPSFDHRLAYLDYEGPVSGGRGTVTRWDAGTFTWVDAGDGVAVRLEGARLRGRACIESDGAGGWRLSFTPLAPLPRGARGDCGPTAGPPGPG